MISANLQPEPMLLTVLFETKYRPLRLAGKSVKGVLHHRETLRKFSAFLGQPATTDNLDDETASLFMCWLADRKMAPSSVNSYIDRLCALWRFAARKNYVREWPEVGRLNEPDRIPQAWSEEQLSRLFGACATASGEICGVRASGWWLALHKVIFDTAERINAVMSLEWKDIDMADGWVIFRAENRKGKTRDIARRLHPDTIDCLRGIVEPARTLVFPWKGCGSDVWRFYGYLLDRAGLPSDRISKFHRLRKSVASYFSAKGGDATALLDHSSRKVTLAYLDPRIVVVQQAADVLTRVFEAEVTPEPAKRVHVVKVKVVRQRSTARPHRRKGPPKKLGPRDLSREVLAYQQARGVARATRYYMVRAVKLLGDYLGHVATIDDLNDGNIDGFLLHHPEGARYWTALRTMWKWCHERSLLAVGPVQKAMPKGGAA